MYRIPREAIVNTYDPTLVSFAKALVIEMISAKARPDSIYTPLQATPTLMIVFSYSFLELKWKSFNAFTATTEKATAVLTSRCVRYHGLSCCLSSHSWEPFVLNLQQLLKLKLIPQRLVLTDATRDERLGRATAK